MSLKTLPCPCCNKPWPWTVTGQLLPVCFNPHAAHAACVHTQASKFSAMGASSLMTSKNQAASECAHWVSHYDHQMFLVHRLFVLFTITCSRQCLHLCLLAALALSGLITGGRLTETCVRCIAQHLLVLVGDPLFNQLVKESAESVQNREDVDSVPIIDDIRYHVTLLHGDGELSGQLHDSKRNCSKSSLQALPFRPSVSPAWQAAQCAFIAWRTIRYE